MRDTPPLRGHLKFDETRRVSAFVPAASVHDDTAWFREWETADGGHELPHPD